MSFDLEPLFPNIPPSKPLMMAGPCSAESLEQVLSVATDLRRDGIHLFRAGVWKPRTSPGSFEGMGEDALKWLTETREKTGILVGTEVGTTRQAELALKYRLDFLWIGARTTSSPFIVEEIAQVLKGNDVAVLVKNPIAPDINLWLGAIQRLYAQGLKRLACIHRGFSVGAESLLRNIPLWDTVQELRDRCPTLPMFCDPSHIAGDATLLLPIITEALYREYTGIFIEVHNNPPVALSDASQQVTPASLQALMASLQLSNDCDDELKRLRMLLDQLDENFIRLLAERFRLTQEIGEWKKKHKLCPYQPNREKLMYQLRSEKGRLYGLSPLLTEELFQVIHKYSLKKQEDEN